MLNNLRTLKNININNRLTLHGTRKPSRDLEIKTKMFIAVWLLLASSQRLNTEHTTLLYLDIQPDLNYELLKYAVNIINAYMLLLNKQICQKLASKIVISILEQYIRQNEHTVFILFSIQYAKEIWYKKKIVKICIIE